MNRVNRNNTPNRKILQWQQKRGQIKRRNEPHLSSVKKSQHSQLLRNRFPNQLIRRQPKLSPANAQSKLFYGKQGGFSQKNKKFPIRDQRSKLRQQYDRSFSFTKPKQQPLNRVKHPQQNQSHGRSLPPSRPNQQTANRSKYSHQKPQMANQRRKPQLKNTNGTILPSAHTPRPNQQLAGRSKYSNLLQQNRKPFRENQNSKLNQQHGRPLQKIRPNPRIRNKSLQTSAVNSKPILFTPQELLRMAPTQDKAMWELIISRLPAEYSIPDPKFIHLYQSVQNQTNNRRRKR